MNCKVRKWQTYTNDLRVRASAGDVEAQSTLHATFDLPLAERLLVVATYVVLVPAAVGLLEILGPNNGWLHF